MQVGCTEPVAQFGATRTIEAPLSRTSRVTKRPPSTVSVDSTFELRRLNEAKGEVLELPRGITVCGLTRVLRTMPGKDQSRSFCMILSWLAYSPPIRIESLSSMNLRPQLKP